MGISDAGQGEISAKATADVCNRLHPSLIGVNMLTIYPDSELYQEIQHGRWEEEREIEKYREIRTLLKHLEIPTQFAALGASNAFQFHRGSLAGMVICTLVLLFGGVFHTGRFSIMLPKALYR